MRQRKQQAAPTTRAMQDEPSGPLLSVEDVAAFLKVSRRTVYTLVRREGLPYYTIRGSKRFILVDIQAWVAARKQVA